MSEIIVLPELQEFIYPLAEHEYKELEEGIKAYGCLSPLVVWETIGQSEPCEDCDESHGYEWRLPEARIYVTRTNKDGNDDTSWEDDEYAWHCRGCGEAQYSSETAKRILIDGHNRYEICKRHDIGYEVRSLVFDSIDAVKIWMAKNQFGRRNLQPFQRAELALKIEPLIAEAALARMHHTTTVDPVPNSAQGPKSPEKTRDVVAEMAQVGHNTIDRAKKIVAEADDQTKADLRAGKTSINAAYKKLKKPDKSREQNGKPKAPEQAVDKLKRPIPDKFLGVALDQRFAELDSLFRTFKELVKSIAGDAKVGHFLREHVTNTDTYGVRGMDSVRYAVLDDSRFYTTCVSCDGTGKRRMDDCVSCQGCGWLTKHRYSQLKGKLEGEAAIK